MLYVGVLERESPLNTGTRTQGEKVVNPDTEKARSLRNKPAEAPYTSPIKTLGKHHRVDTVALFRKHIGFGA